MKKKKLIDLVMEKGLADSELKALGMVMAGHIIVNDHRIDKAGTLVPIDADIRLKSSKKSQYVSRGGDKLIGALERFNIDCNDNVCLDIGLSTGGFTDVLLQKGARYVFGVDVSYGILDLKIRENPKTIILEKTNARNLTKTDLETEAKYQIKNPDIANEIALVVMDVSFISITKLLPQLKDIVKKECEFICLVKPQFEAPQDWVGDGGIISDQNILNKTLESVKNKIFEMEVFEFLDECTSPITGTKGNQESFFYLSLKQNN